MKDISVVLPCLNEEQGIRVCIQKILNVFKENNLNGEIIVVDNGCTDNTVEIAKRFPKVKLIYEPKMGYGNAYIAGFKWVKGKIVVLGDADNSYDFYDIPKFLHVLKNCDFVVGKRNVILEGSMPFLHRKVGQPLFYVLMKCFFNIPISDSHCGFGAIKKKTLDKLDLKSTGMEFASEILIKAKKNNLIIEEIPIIYSPRLGESKLRTFRDGFRHLNLIVREFVK